MLMLREYVERRNVFHRWTLRLLHWDVLPEYQARLDELLGQIRRRRGDRAEQVNDGLFGDQARILVDDHVEQIIDQIAARLARQIVADEDRLLWKLRFSECPGDT